MQIIANHKLLLSEWSEEKIEPQKEHYIAEKDTTSGLLTSNMASKISNGALEILSNKFSFISSGFLHIGIKLKWPEFFIDNGMEKLFKLILV